ncbi:MAG: VOC family protein [Actinomycetota bacterium]|nr:VOC family protein [Actinomycetota bacterium]
MADLIPYLVARDAGAAIAFYVDAFGATELSRWTEPGTGKIGHAELEVGGRRMFVADEWPEGGVTAPREGADTPMSLVLDVDDIDGVFARAVALGARVERPVTDAHGDRGGWLFDPAGHRWSIVTSGKELSRDELQEQVGAAYEIT